MSIYDTHVPESGDGLYLKLKDGDEATIRIISEPAIFETENERDGKITISTRYGWLVWNRDKQRVQIMQQSATFYKTIAGLAKNKNWGDPATYDISISRSGSGPSDTTYAVVPIPNREPISGEMEAAAREVDLIAKLSASPFARSVYWLAEFDTNPPVKDKVAAMPEDGNVNLNDIPF